MKIKEVKQQLQEGPAWDQLKGRMGAAANAFVSGSQQQQDTRKSQQAEKIYVDSMITDLDQAIKSGYVVMPTPKVPKAPQNPPAPDYSKYQSPAVNRRGKNAKTSTPAGQQAKTNQQVTEVDWDQRLLGLLGEAKTGISIAQWIEDYVTRTFDNYEMRDNDPAVKFTKQLANQFQSVYNPANPGQAKQVAAKIFSLVNTVAKTRQKVSGTYLSGNRPRGGAKNDKEVKMPRIVSKEPIIMSWDGKRYGLNDRGEWAHLVSGQVPPEALQRFLDQHHDASLGINK